MRFVKAVSKFRRHPELRIYECDQCLETAVEEWRPRENAGRQMPNSRSRRTLMMLLLLRPPAARFSYGVIENRRH
jgi:hypothetical protein